MARTDLIDRNAAHNGRECPFCCERDGIEWNGIKGRDCGYACNGDNGCAQQWDAIDYSWTDEDR